MIKAKKTNARVRSKKMSLEDYSSDPVDIGCDSVRVEYGDCRPIQVTLENICWIDVAGAIADSDDDFIKCFIKAVRTIQRNA